jgi:hypothetical protein
LGKFRQRLKPFSKQSRISPTKRLPRAVAYARKRRRGQSATPPNP